MEDPGQDETSGAAAAAPPGTPARVLLVLCEVLALAGLVAARANAPGNVFHSDLIVLAWLLAGLHLWRGLAVLGRAPTPPLLLLALEGIALCGWLDDGPWLDPAQVEVSYLERLIRWRGVYSVGTQPLWALLSALAVLGACLLRAARSEALAAQRARILLWSPRLALAAVGLACAIWFLGASAEAWRSDAPAALQQSRAFSWRTGTRHRVLRGRFSGVWAVAEGLSPEQPALLRYRSEGLSGTPVARWVAVEGAETRILSQSPLQRTSPGVVRLVIPPPRGALPSERLRLELHAANDPRFAGTLELAAPLRLRNRFAAAVEREGWLPALSASVATPALLALLLLYLYAQWGRLSAWKRWPGAALALMACGSWLALSAPALRLLFGWLALIPATLLMGLQSWLVLLPFVEAIPPLATFGPDLQSVMSGQLGPIFYGRPISAGATPEYLARLDARLGSLSAIPTWLVGAGVLSLILVAFLSARPRGAAPRDSRRRPSTYLFALGGLGYVLYPSWHLPIEPTRQRLAGLLLLGGLVVVWRSLRWLEERIPRGAPQPLWDPAALVVLLLYLLLRVPDLFLPVTFNSDEGGFRSSSDVIYSAQRQLLGLSDSLGHRALVVGILLAAGAFLWALAKRFTDFDRWLVGAAGLALLAWVLWLPTPPWDVMTTFRYPPLAKVIPGTLAWITGASLPASRFWCLLSYALSGYAVFLGARRLGLARAASFGALVFYLALNMTFYWSVFAYNTAFLVGFTALAAVPFLTWVRSAEPESLAWASFWLATASASRVTGIVSFAIFFLGALATLATSPRHRTRGNAWAMAFLLCAVLPGALLWHKVLVGGWYGWVGRYLEWQQFLGILGDYDRWRLMGHSILHMNGAWSCALIFLGLAAFVRSRHESRRLGGWLLAGWLVLATMAPIILGRGQVWDGLPRFVLPALLPASLLVGVGFDALQRRFGRWPALLLLTPLLLFGRDPVANQPAVLPTDLNVYVQYRGRSHGFLPDREIAAALPEGLAHHEVGILHESGIVSQYFRQCEPSRIETLEQIEAEMQRKGFRCLVLPYAPDPVANDALWRFQRSRVTIDPKIWRDPETLAETPWLEPAGVVSFGDVEYRIFLRSEAR